MNENRILSASDFMSRFTNIDFSKSDKLTNVWKKVVSKISVTKFESENSEKRMSIGERLAGNTRVVDLKNGILLIETDEMVEKLMKDIKDRQKGNVGTASEEISEKENKITGYIGLSVIIDEGYILNVAVHPDYQGMGIGKELVKYVNDFAVENNLTFVTLEVRPTNKKAINLYTGFGFKKVGERKDYYSNPKENALLLTKYYISKKE